MTHRTRRAPARKSAAAPAPSRPAFPGLPALPGLEAAVPLLKVAQNLRHWADSVIGMAASAGDLSLYAARTRATAPRERERIDQAATMLRRAREAAGLTTEELSRAIGLDDPKELTQAEGGVVALPFEVVLRLPAVLGRHDPTLFAMKLARSYNPTLWKALDELGIGRLVALAGRERELANLYRGNDAARTLSDDDFADVMAFTRSAFDMAVKFRNGEPPSRRARTAPRRSE